MPPLLLAVGSPVAYLIAYHTYGRWLARKIFGLNPANKAPSIEFEDGDDFVPTSKGVVFGHHFTSIAATTMDSACRLQRYVTQELGAAINFKLLMNKHIATIFAITLAGLIAGMPAAGADYSVENLGKGGLVLWPLFGATNQLLGGLAFLVILFWMWRRNMPIWFVAIPAVFMLILPAVAMVSQLFMGDAAWLTGKNPNYLLATIGIVTLALEAWILVEAAKAWPKAKGVLEEAA